MAYLCYFPFLCDTNIQRLFIISKCFIKNLQNNLKKIALYLIVTTIIAGVIVYLVTFAVSVFNDGRDRIIREIYENERRTRDSLQLEINQIKRDGLLIQQRIDSLSVSISKTDAAISQKLNSLKNDLFKDVRNYRDSSNSALLNRLRTTNK